MPNRDKTGPRGEGPGTGGARGGCTTEGQLEKTRNGLRGGGNRTPRGCGNGNCRGRRRGANGVTYYT